ncbi:transcriptional regulator, AraC family [Coriobacterium glomerans PW2]|uniref:Transcriptional regulator, AraC family n=1 Tax=Coriobacterium glomerans (strain ATCC 49209 / DSM 20642 / JCM 10262 / PW2) TaxID=700015 RepID=F2N7C9_CORGP|nr:PocR ligand-binding domain-containing protein [Coriobacterium glomerans]AEB06604.1 transcriptional regulator, AraC family [Coriobacterium glomerans PW2]
MENGNYLKQLVALQDDMANLFNMAILIVDCFGHPVDKHSGRTAFCERVREDPELCRRCEKCDSRGGIEAMRLGVPYIYRCHFDIAEIAVPIVWEGSYLGAILAGEFKLRDSGGGCRPERVVSQLSQLPSAEFARYYGMLPIIDQDEVIKVSLFLLHLVGTLTSLFSMAERQAGAARGTDGFRGLAPFDRGFEAPAQRWSRNDPAAIAQTGSRERSPDEHLTRFDFTETLVHFPALKPALTYIMENFDENPKLPFLADLCHLSTCYFSRLFARAMGRPYSVFIHEIKITWGKDLLRKTDLSVADISFYLGYACPSYFIQRFKAATNLTPGEYRRFAVKTSERMTQLAVG